MTVPWPPAPAKWPISAVDLTIYIISLVLTVLVGLVVTIVQLVRRRLAWPFASGTLVLCGVICLFGGVGYFAAVGA
ncbi:MAG: hypothetical protein QOC69_2606 [Mycobacterium sp.]|nr:hypothetical protein [Mycobacterium sp.]